MDVKQGELVLCEFYFSDLEQSKRRPVIVFRDNLPFGDFVGIPVSSKIDRLDAMGSDPTQAYRLLVSEVMNVFYGEEVRSPPASGVAEAAFLV